MFATAAVIFSLLLIVTGVAKLVRPHDVEQALVGLGLPRVPFAGVFVGAAEIAIGVAAVFFVTALLAQGVLYLTFAVWVLVALRLEVPLASCGCLGRDDTPPSWGHFGLNLLAAGVSLAAALTGPMSWVWGVEGIATIVIVAVGVFLAYVVLTDGARLSGVRAR
jgi:hypothetical protein